VKSQRDEGRKSLAQCSEESDNLFNMVDSCLNDFAFAFKRGCINLQVDGTRWGLAGDTDPSTKLADV
jgi:hypothetical protein